MDTLAISGSKANGIGQVFSNVSPQVAPGKSAKFILGGTIHVQTESPQHADNDCTLPVCGRKLPAGPREIRDPTTSEHMARTTSVGSIARPKTHSPGN